MKVLIHFAGGETLHLPDAEAERFEACYQQWLASDRAHAEFEYHAGTIRHCVRLDGIMHRELREPHRVEHESYVPHGQLS